MDQILTDISTNLQVGKAKIVVELVSKALADGVPPKTILDEGLLAGMSVIGQKFKNNEVFVPEVLVAARAMNKGAELLKPALAAEGVSARGVAVIGTVKGDLHDIGKNLVKMMMEGKGIEMHDLGVDVSPERFVEAAQEHNASIICLSALLTTTMTEMKNVVETVKASSLAGKVAIMVGGAPVTQAFCDQIGADCYTPDAASAADEALRFLAS
ncbi:MAG: corrinoid protein [Clostridiales bacterium]|jgi:corrinoid protein of di/trimethylamine methyltransferase|nr:corrinoid protein [Clostridiales bacterium]